MIAHHGTLRRPLRKPAFVLCWILLMGAMSCSHPSKKNELIIIAGKTMGTGYTIKINDHSSMDKGRVSILTKGIEAVLEKTNLQMSIYQENSEITDFNRTRHTDWFAVSPETARVIEQSLLISEKSLGALDITAGPLVKLWGFGPGTGEKSTTLPGEEAIRRARLHQGYKKMAVRLSPPAVRKNDPEIYCDLGAIAKGHGVDEIARYLAAMGLSDFLVEIGGEVKASGKNNRNSDWQIGIESPDSNLAIHKVVSLRDTAMATSGDYRNYFLQNGIRYSHIIDPRTGKPVTHELSSVTVIHDACSYADAWATALYVLGPEEGYEAALKEELAVFFIIREKEGSTEKMTPPFQKYLSSNHTGLQE